MGSADDPAERPTRRPRLGLWAARLVLVPVSNPRTAPGLLHLAWNLADRREGHVIALYVEQGDTERDDDAVEGNVD